LDEQIGKILKALEASGRADNTYIFFTGDHGLSVGKHGLLGKQSLFDHSIRVPLLITGPDIPKNKTIEHEIYLQDIMASSLELAEIPKPKSVAFKSFLSLIKGKEKKLLYPEGIYGAYMDSQRMIRKDGYKLIIYPKIKKILLFDLKNDPLEQHDISDKIRHRNTVKNLFQNLLLLQRKHNDSLDLSGILAP
jgi:arylsulfatase A-like enzyme